MAMFIDVNIILKAQRQVSSSHRLAGVHGNGNHLVHSLPICFLTGKNLAQNATPINNTYQMGIALIHL